MEIISGRAVTVQDVKQALELDRLVYGEQYQSTLERILASLAVNPDVHIMVKDNGRIVAYTNISPVTDEAYALIKSGSFVDTGLEPHMLVPYNKTRLHSVYFSSAVVHPDYQNGDMFFVVYNAVMNKLLALSGDGIFIRRIVADAVSDKGKRLCGLMGMKKVKDSGHDSMLYEVEMLPVPGFRVVSEVTKKLFEVYSNKGGA